MVNFGLNSASILGIFLAIAGASLYFMRSFRPELSRDQDIFFAAVGLLCGFILLFQGWRLDPILQFGQFLLTAMAVAFGVETIRLRAATTEQAKRSAPTVDRDRRTSRVYRAEIDDMEPYFEEEEPTDTRRRLRGTTVERSPRSDRYDEGYEQETPRPSKTRSSRSKRKPSTRSRTAPDYYYDEEPNESYDRRDVEEDRDDYIPPRQPRSRREDSNPPTRTSRKPRPRPRDDESRERRSASTRSRPPVSRPPSRRRPAPPKEDYVDYKPIDPPENEDDPDNSNQFDY
ncbi:Ycf66 family protein [Halothece sp. PCC 7418]|uniref:Ycf66 family protein n=1 Tax=Halothece sp. (strain PCC 7418) TaxID=65093 RepID=UPI0002A0891E|nr:Ycf66 family protein [Halothece sp. PCC 7418]AFZ43984.1 Ycf66 family protein [Halothece sp. PCC 7418]